MRSTLGNAEKENESSPDVTTACYLSLEPPSENLFKADNVKKKGSEVSKVNICVDYLRAFLCFLKFKVCQFNLVNNYTSSIIANVSWVY